MQLNIWKDTDKRTGSGSVSIVKCSDIHAVLPYILNLKPQIQCDLVNLDFVSQQRPGLNVWKLNFRNNTSNITTSGYWKQPYLLSVSISFLVSSSVSSKSPVDIWTGFAPTGNAYLNRNCLLINLILSSRFNKGGKFSECREK